ncbi:MAG: DUF1311 domain-containing protein [Alphaproteobacteria bacterium]|nr:DUF1311 domain-containing protein [Alphaproteobacteria bacterium]
MRAPALAAALAAGVSFCHPAAAFDCAEASTDTEKDICASPELKAADDEMSAAYAATLPRLATPQQALLKSNQRAWLKQRAEHCGYDDEASSRTQCLLDKTRRRASFLSGSAETGPGLTQAMTPFVVSRPQSKTECRAEMAVNIFGAPATRAGEKLFDKLIGEHLDAIESESGARTVEPGAEYDCEYEGGAALTYGSPDLIAANVSTYVYGGGAHGNTNTVAFLVDLKNGRVPAYKDHFDDAGTSKLVEACSAALRAEKIKRLADPDDPNSEATVKEQVDEDMKTYADTIAESIQDLSNWLVYGDRAEIYFAPYAIGSYAEGEYTCALPKALLQQAAGAKAWLIP